MRLKDVLYFPRKWYTVSKSPLFDKNYYHDMYGVSKPFCVIHYLLKGWMNGFDPSRAFSTKEYVGLYKDVDEAGVCPLWHFIVRGGYERRLYVGVGDCDLHGCAFLHALFDAAWYSKTYMSDEEIRHMSPIEHYETIGWRKRHLPFSDFNLDDFESICPDCNESPLRYLLTHDPIPLFNGVDLKEVRAGYGFDAYYSHLYQTEYFGEEHPRASEAKKIVLFIVTEIDAISGGLMSIAGMYEIISAFKQKFGYDDVVAINCPWSSGTLFKYTLFDNDMPMFRYEQLVNIL